MMRIFGLCFLFSLVYAENRAIVVLSGVSVNGAVKFTETADGILVEADIQGLKAGKHGFHIHDKGDLTNGCASTGPHFNPYKKQHGAPSVTERHIGDLGNIVANDAGIAKIAFVDKLISLKGETNILGRAVVVHEGEDDLGLGGANDSLTTGHAGGRVACGIIGIL